MGVKGCPIERTVNILEGKWTLLILRELFTGTKRFGELRSALTGVSPKTLSERLRILEQQGIVKRTIYPEVPPRVEYSLTELGETLSPIIEALRQWGTEWADQVLARTG
ncbi:MAG: helix-turn-helix transcriptional regulator [Anaerolineae bacterium]|nr:helix-turn-helix transcriptional regulator [Anaerolineae bacterium]